MITANYNIPRGMGRGLIQRDMQQAPLGSSAPMFSRPLIPDLSGATGSQRSANTKRCSAISATSAGQTVA
jgi:hypothetical protein